MKPCGKDSVNLWSPPLLTGYPRETRWREKEEGWPEKKKKRDYSQIPSMSFGFVKACAFCWHLLQKVCRMCRCVCRSRGDWVCVIKWVNCTSRAGQIVAASSVSVKAVFDCAFPELFPAGSFDSVFSGLLRDACRSLCDQAVWYAHLFPAWKSKLTAALAETHFSGKKSLDTV